MQKTKKLLAVLLCMAMLTAVLPVVSFGATIVDSGTCGVNLTWTLNSDGLLTISGTGALTGSPGYKSNAIKSVVIEEGVMGIGNYTFDGCNSLTSVKIPKSVTSIGDRAFWGCDSLTRIDVNVVDMVAVGDITIHYASMDGVLFRLGSIHYDSLGLAERRDTTLIQYPIGRSGEYSVPQHHYGLVVTHIRESAFEGCKNLTSVKIPDNVTHIGDRAFYGCESLTSVSLTGNVTHIGDQAFWGCDSLVNIDVIGTLPSSELSYTTYASKDGVLFDLTSVTFAPAGNVIDGTATLFQYPIGRSGTYSMPRSVDMAFKVTRIGDYAFYGCSGLTGVSIADSVKSIDNHAFDGCPGLTSIDVSVFNSYYASIDGVLFDKNMTTLLKYPIGRSGTYSIPDGVTSLPDRVFANCENLTSVSIPDSVTSIGDNAFESCKSLTSIIIPDSVTRIPYRAFANCDSLTSVSIPNSVTSIGNWAFANCHGLTSVSIGNSVTSIGDWAFNGCDSLTSISIPDSVTSIGDRVFASCDSLTSINVDENNSSYASIDGVLFNKALTTLLQYPIGNSRASYSIPSGVTSIGGYAFAWCQSLTSVSIPNSVTSIGEWAFEYCYSLTSISIPSSVTSIGDWAFYYCDRLRSIRIPSSVTSIGDWAFYYCDRLTNVYYSGSEEEWNNITIGDRNEPLTDATIHFGGIEEVEEIASGDCGANLTWTLNSDGLLTISGTGDMYNWRWDNSSPWYNMSDDIDKVVIEYGVTSIGNRAFAYCYRLTSVSIPSSVTSIGDWAFEGCDRLTSINVDENNSSYASIDGVLFNKALTTLLQYPAGNSRKSYSIPSSVTSIGYSAFNGCDSLTISIPSSVTSIGNWAFANCHGLRSVSIPSGVTSIGECTFACCQSLMSISIPDSVTSIGNGAFDCCDSLTSVSIPSSVTSIGDGAFAMCDSLTSINVDENNSYYASIDGVLFNKALTTLLQYPAGNSRESYSIPSSVTSIGESAFEWCDRLTSINVDENNSSYASIDGVLFNKALTTLLQYPAGNSRKSYSIPSSVTSIGNWAFANCHGLRSVSIPSGVKSIGDEAFYYCRRLTSVSIPSSVKSIGDEAFDCCDSLTDVYYSGSEKRWNNITIGYGNEPLTDAVIHFGGDTTVPEIVDVKITPSNGSLNVSAETDNLPANAAVMAIGYSGGGEVKEAAQMENGSAEMKSDGVKTVKILVWESLETMRPLCEAKTVTVQ